MPSIDFYFISASTEQSTRLFACRLLEKAYSQQHQIYVHMEDLEKARFLNNLLWTFRDESFIPHQLASDHEQGHSPIEIGCTETIASSHQDILLNLHSLVPPFHEQFKRVLEIVPNEEKARLLAEEHRSFYEKKGYKITLHQLHEAR